MTSLLLVGGTCLCQFATAQTTGYFAPESGGVAPENAAREALSLSAREAPLRLAGMDLFPHAAATVQYDDNLLISPSDQLHDEVWTLSPGFMLAAGDVSASLPGTVTIEQLRSALYFSLLDETAKPERFIGIDYTPAVNLFTHNSHFNNADQLVRLSSGYALNRFNLGLDFDFSRIAEKNSSAGTRLTTTVYDPRLRGRYELTDRTALEVDGEYRRQEYELGFQGYQEFRNEDWIERQVGEKVSVDAGAAFGLVWPDFSPNQTYEQLLARGNYRLTGKLELRASVGVEWRQYEDSTPSDLFPVFGVAALYQPRPSTTFTLEGHRRNEPSPFGGVNYIILGFSAGVRQLLWNRLYGSLSGGFDQVNYQQTQAGGSANRSDSYFSVDVRLDYALNPRWTAGIFYSHREDNSNEPTFTYANNLVGFQAAWNF